MTKDFQNEVKDALSSFLYKDVCFFAWLCAVRALPFLAVRRDFDYWKHTKNGDQRQKHLFAILHALDNATYYAADDSYSASAASAAAFASVAASSTRTPYGASSADSYAASAASAVASATASAAAISAASSARSPFAATSAASVATLAALAADSACSAVASTDDVIYRLDLRDIMLEDLKILKTENRKFQNDPAIYGPIWDRFQGALRDLGCGYWGEWYAHVFAKGFILDDKDREKIKRRLSVPGEIMERGAADVARYISELKEYGTMRLNEARVIILGNKGSGKTSLANRLKDPIAPMPKDEESTAGVDVIDWAIPADPYRLDSGVNVYIWDFAGHVITHAVHPCFMSERCLYILVVDGRTEDNRIEYWLEQIRNYGGKDSPVLVLVNVRDRHWVDLPKNALEKEFPSIKGFYEANIHEANKTVGGEKFKEFRQVVMKFLRDNPLWNQKISVPAYKVKEALRQKFVEGHNFIERSTFNEIATVNGLKSEDRKQLLVDLRDLGICLWYGDAVMGEFSTMVLDPSWISHGIYRLINWGLKQKKETLSRSDFCEVFNDNDAYPEDKAGFLFKLMKTYKLAFFKDKEDTEIFVPLLRPVDRPKDGLPTFEFEERLRIEYCANQALPPYTVARLAVLHSKEWDTARSWRFGAVLCWEGTEALVEENERARSVTVFVKGPKKSEYIAKIRNTLDVIFNDYKNSRPELKYEIRVPEPHTSQVALRLLQSPNFLNTITQPLNQIIDSAKTGQMLYVGMPQFGWVDPATTINVYNLTIYGDVQMRNKTTDKSIHIGNSQTITLSFQNSSSDLQRELNALAQRFSELDNSETDELSKELREVASDVNKITKEIPANATLNSPEMAEVRRSLRSKGLLNRLEKFYDELCDENSELHKKAVKVLKNIQKLGSHYNDVAQWVGLPQIPKPFLATFGKKDSVN